MAKYLLVDIGAGTMDVLYFDEANNRHFKAVVLSPVPYIAGIIENTIGNLAVTGMEMGGGPVTGALKKRAKTHEVVVSVSAAATLHHDRERVAAWGIRVVEDDMAARLSEQSGYEHIRLADIDIGRLNTIVAGLGVPFHFDVVGICAQDHGVPPHGVSHLDFRHQFFRKALDQNPSPEALLHRASEIPAYLNRLKAIGACAADLPADDLFVMDSGMAAILGASQDELVKNLERSMVLDVATSHTLGAALLRGEIAGFFEYHTSDISAERIDGLLRDLANGELSHEQILQEGGHGAYIRQVVGFDRIEKIIATGPQRHLISESKLSILPGAPMGDNMMTGCLGLLNAIRLHNGQDLITGV